jgi:glycosyltransferase involved in cell wall biosynthesis
MLLVDATTAQHTHGIRTVTAGILAELPRATSEPVVAAAGPGLEPVEGLRLRRVALARTRPGRLLYQRLLLPIEISRLSGALARVDRVLLLDSYVPLVRPQRGVRYAALVHDVLPLTHPDFWPSPKRLVKRLAFSSLRRSGATLFTSSEHNAREIERLLGTEAKVIRFGCGQLSDAEADEARVAPLPEREQYLVYVGAVEPRKDVLSLLDAFDATAAALGAELGLTIVGDGPEPYAAEVRARIAESRYGKRIRFLSGADRETTLRLVSRAGALVFPTLAEGFGLPILEALALGTPVVASDLTEIRAWAGGAILYAPPAQPMQWAQPVAAALGTDAVRRREGQKLAASFRWRNAAETVVRF